MQLVYRCEELQSGGEEGEEEGQDGVAQAVEGGGRQLIVIVHVVTVTLPQHSINTKLYSTLHRHLTI
jgi:hypothetical protein